MVPCKPGPKLVVSGTGPVRIKTGPAKQQKQFWIRVDPYRTGSKTVPFTQKAYFPTESFWNRLELVPYKHSLTLKPLKFETKTDDYVFGCGQSSLGSNRNKQNVSRSTNHNRQV